MKQSMTQRLAKFATYTILIFGAAFILLPFVWMISTSLKPDATLFPNGLVVPT